METHIQKDDVDREIFNNDGFLNRLKRHRKPVYKNKRSVIASKNFLKRYDELDSTKKEYVIAITQIITHAKIPSLYGKRVVDTHDMFVVDVYGLCIFYKYGILFQTVKFIDIESSASKTNQLNLLDNSGFGNKTPEWIACEEEMLRHGPYTTKYGFDSFFELEEYRKNNGFKTTYDVIVSKGYNHD